MRLRNLLRKILTCNDNKFLLLVVLSIAGFLLIPIHVIDTELQPYVNWYMAKVTEKCNTWKYYHPGQMLISLDNIQNDPNDEKYTIGSCWKKLNRFDLVIDKKYWDSVTEDNKYELITHELTHCLFLQEHSDDNTNFMYYQNRGMKMKELEKQFNDFLDKACR